MGCAEPVRIKGAVRPNDAGNIHGTISPRGADQRQTRHGHVDEVGGAMIELRIPICQADVAMNDGVFNIVQSIGSVFRDVAILFPEGKGFRRNQGDTFSIVRFSAARMV